MPAAGSRAMLQDGSAFRRRSVARHACRLTQAPQEAEATFLCSSVLRLRAGRDNAGAWQKEIEIIYVFRPKRRP